MIVQDVTEQVKLNTGNVIVKMSKKGNPYNLTDKQLFNGRGKKIYS